MEKILSDIKEALQIEADSLQLQSNQLNIDYVAAVEEIVRTNGRLVVTGMGKSGIIGHKISATFASTGTPSFFMHPAEAFHGDLGMVSPEDIVLAISNSGETDELLRLIPFFKENGNKIISISGNERSSLAKNSDIHLKLQIEKEACPFNLAPTTSTTVTLAIGDALAVAAMKLRSFRTEDYARFHPGGSLGKRLLLKVKDVMRTEDIPMVDVATKVQELLYIVSAGRLGLAVVKEGDEVLGIVTDGDIRRAILKHQAAVFDLKTELIMTRNPKSIRFDQRIVDAQEVLKQNKIHSLLVIDDKEKMCGIVDVFNLEVL